ncbi:hypothetical protein KZX45_15590 [Georgenia sp. EYE_87]|uniref:DUF6318 family protein n=1 Tax=Georgenia sp. EYE_87 TaxID=2853448 RepID=UPI002005D15C|nr:DUF6318 family protein [Georgenia sp. EYE_87]MCK6211968.1 hypothetical protein [Georgenia sp. EYE_87]
MRQGDKLHRRLMVLGAVLGLAGGLAACTSGGGAEPEPSTSSGVTSAPTAVPSDEPTSERPEVPKPVPPETMARDDVAGAEAAAQYFLELYPYVYATGDLSEWKAMSEPECVFCQSVIDEVTEQRRLGGTTTGGGVELESIQGFDRLEGNDYFRVDALVNQAESTHKDKDGSVTKSEPGGENLLIFAIGRADGDWSVRAVQVEEPGFNVNQDA